MTFVEQWSSAIGTTLSLMAVSSIIALLGGVMSAWSVSGWQQREARGKVESLGFSIWTSAMLVSLALPLILHAAAWEATAGKFGWLTQTMTGGNLFWVGWIHGCHGIAIVGLATAWSTASIDPATIRHAHLDYRPMAVWWRVRLPLAWPWVAAAVLLVMVLAATEMSVADLHSVRTVADQFYLFHAIDPSSTALIVTTVVPLVIGGPLIAMRFRFRGVDPILNHSFDHAHASPARGRLANLQAVMAIASVMLVFALPVSGLLVQAGHVVRLVDGERRIGWSLSRCVSAIGEAPSLFASEYRWTVLLGVLTTLVVIPVGWFLARSCRVRPRWTMPIDTAAIFLFLIPGPIIGLFCTRLFAGDNDILTMLATRTLVPTILAVGLRPLIVVYFILRIGYSGIAQHAWQAARLDGNTLWRLRHVEGPLLKNSLMFAIVASLIMTSGEVPATLPVLPPGVTTVGTRLFGLLHSGARYQEASLAFWHVATIACLGAGCRWVNRRRRFPIDVPAD